MTQSEKQTKPPIILGVFMLFAMLCVAGLLFMYVLYVASGPMPPHLPDREPPATEDTSPDVAISQTDTGEPARPAPAPAPAPDPVPAETPPEIDPRHREPPPVVAPGEFRPRPPIERVLPDGSIERIEPLPDLRPEAMQVHRDLELTLRLLADLLR